MKKKELARRVDALEANVEKLGVAAACVVNRMDDAAVQLARHDEMRRATHCLAEVDFGTHGFSCNLPVGHAGDHQ